eukprot:299413_1
MAKTTKSADNSLIKSQTMASKNDNLYKANYVWKINGNKLTQMVQANNKQKFLSDTFEIASMDWRIYVYPNGNRDNNVGAFKVYLKLLSTQNEHKIIIFRRIHCKEYHTSFSSIEPYKKNKSNGWPDYTLWLNEIKNSNLKELNLIVDFQMLR